MVTGIFLTFLLLGLSRSAHDLLSSNIFLLVNAIIRVDILVVGMTHTMRQSTLCFKCKGHVRLLFLKV